MESIPVIARRLALLGLLFVFHPWRRGLAGLGLMAAAYAMALWGWYAYPPELVPVQGRGLEFVARLGMNAGDSLLSVGALLNQAAVVRGWQTIVPLMFLAGLAILVLPFPLQPLRNRLILGLTRGLPRQSVIIGDGGLAEAMLLRGREDGQAVIWGVDEPTPPPTPLLSDVPQWLLSERWFEPLCLDDRVNCVAILGPDGELNQSLAEHCLQVAGRSPRRTGQRRLRLIVRLESARLRRYWADDARLRARQSRISVQVFSLCSLQARALLCDRGLDRLVRLEKSGELVVVIVVFDETVDELVLQLVRLSHFSRPRHLVCHLIGVNAEHEVSRFHAINPGLETLVSLRPVPLNPDAPDFAQALVSRMSVFGTLDPGMDVLFLPGEGRSGNLQGVALEIESAFTRRGYQPPPLYRLGEPPCPSRHRSRTEAGAAALSVDPRRLLDSGLELLLDDLPRAIHEDYLENCLARGDKLGDRPSLVPWDELTADFAEDNRAQVDHFWVKARELDARIERCNSEEPTATLLQASEIEALAIAEHNRWWACRLSLGWTYAPERCDERRQHPNMVPWDRLEEPDRDKDREAVRQFPRVLVAHGYRLVRMQRGEPVEGARQAAETPAPSARYGSGSRLTVLGVTDVGSARTALALINAGEAVEVHLAASLLDCTGSSRFLARLISQGAWRLVLVPPPARAERRTLTTR